MVWPLQFLGLYVLVGLGEHGRHSATRIGFSSDCPLHLFDVTMALHLLRPLGLGLGLGLGFGGRRARLTEILPLFDGVGTSLQLAADLAVLGPDGCPFDPDAPLAEGAAAFFVECCECFHHSPFSYETSPFRKMVTSSDTSCGGTVPVMAIVKVVVSPSMYGSRLTPFPSR